VLSFERKSEVIKREKGLRPFIREGGLNGKDRGS